MNELLIAYARVSTYEQDLTAQRNAQLAELFNVGRATVYRTVRRQEGLIGPKYGH
jgi:transposase